MNDRDTVKRILSRCTKERIIEFALDYREGYFAMIAKYEMAFSTPPNTASSRPALARGKPQARKTKRAGG